MHTAGRKQAHDMNSSVSRDRLIYRLTKGSVGKEVTASDSLIYTGKVLIDHAPGAESHVPDFRITHLTLWQTYLETRSMNQGLGVAGPKVFPYWRVGIRHSVVLVRFAVAEAVKNKQHKGFSLVGHS